ncbi:MULTISPECIES: hypothetical protein [Bradyrhizobium]|uniref:hypothetical protein n=1 Tax=Bradyrhizobium TaxID=374 RepID=UPI0004870CE5|nr:MULTISPECIES: hypothetical protein [Bradyrhizobium]QOG22246.1 hypothetical protein FOM02_38115 [Bradyrhizobium sp. SEMIA]UFW50018.1 hypothetical protein BaraCB756_02720 [Bradyrhizobium arachidis]
MSSAKASSVAFPDIGEPLMCMRFWGKLTTRAVILVCFSTVCALADELPKNLLLKCEGKLTIILSKPTIESLSPKTFSTTLSLREGELADNGSAFLNTGNCELKNGVVICTGKAVYPSTIDAGSESRVMKSYINQETGEYSFFMETTHHAGRNATGSKSEGMKYMRNGVCRSIGKPIF